MKNVGIVGLGDMGLAMAKNIIAGGFPLTGFDLREDRRSLLETAGGKPASSPAQVGRSCDVVLVMVLNGQQVETVVCGEQGLLTTLRPGSTIVVSATIAPTEMRRIGRAIVEKGVEVIDTPVSGGQAGAAAGSLTMMAAAQRGVLAAQRDAEILQAFREVRDEIRAWIDDEEFI